MVVFLRRLKGGLRRCRTTDGSPRGLRGQRGGRRRAGSQARGPIDAAPRGRTGSGSHAAEDGRSNRVIQGPLTALSKMRAV